MSETYDWRGRPYMQSVFDHGARVALVFWSDFDGPVPREGDLLILRSGNAWGSRYKVTGVKRALAEGDVVSLTADHDRRTSDEVAADIERFGMHIRKPLVL